MDQVIVSDSNRTPVVQIITWLCLVTSVLAFFTHVGIKLYMSRVLGLETVLVVASLVFCTAQSITVSVQTSNGFGKPSESLQDDQLEAILKSGYAATMLFFFAIAFSKFAVIAFIHGLTPKKLDRRINYGIGAFAVLWLLAFVFALAFQCKPPRTWDLSSGQCINRVAWWDAATITNIISEVAIVVLEICVMVPLRMPVLRKVQITSLFASRLFVAISAIIQLYYFHMDSSSPLQKDFSLGYWRSTICNQIVQCLAIVTTTLPYAKMFMESFESGLIRVDELRRKGEQSTDGSGRGYKLLDISRNTMPGSRNGQHEGITRTKTYSVERNEA